MLFCLAKKQKGDKGGITLAFFSYANLEAVRYDFKLRDRCYPWSVVNAKEVNRMRIFLMNDDYGTVVAAKDEEQAQKYFKSTFDCEVDDDYCSVKREINPGEIGIFEDVGTMTFGEFVKGIPEEKIPVILCWAE